MVRSGRGQVGAASSGVAPHRSGGRDGGGRAGSGGLLGLTVARLAVVGLDHLRGTCCRTTIAPSTDLFAEPAVELSERGVEPLGGVDSKTVEDLRSWCQGD